MLPHVHLQGNIGGTGLSILSTYPSIIKLYALYLWQKALRLPKSTSNF